MLYSGPATNTPTCCSSSCGMFWRRSPDWPGYLMQPQGRRAERWEGRLMQSAQSRWPHLHATNKHPGDTSQTPPHSSPQTPPHSSHCMLISRQLNPNRALRLQMTPFSMARHPTAVGNILETPPVTAFIQHQGFLLQLYRGN